MLSGLINPARRQVGGSQVTMGFRILRRLLNEVLPNRDGLVEIAGPNTSVDVIPIRLLRGGNLVGLPVRSMLPQQAEPEQSRNENGEENQGTFSQLTLMVGPRGDFPEFS